MRDGSSGRRRRCLQGAAGVIVAGLVWRLVPLGMPAGMVKYGGSVLWAAMVYLLVAGTRPGWSAGRVTAVAGCVAFSVEGFKLVHGAGLLAGLDAFRRTGAGKLLLGRVFGWWDLVVYGMTIGACGWLDRRVKR